MVVKIALNGFGRIGRTFMRAALMDKEFMEKFEVAAINDLADPQTLLTLFKYDSIHGVLKHGVKIEGENLVLNGKKIRMLAERDVSNVPWKELGVEIVLEATGIFRDRASAEEHIKAGAKKVVISAPAKGEDISLVPGVNMEKYDREKHNIISMCSCTTNCLAPVAKVLNDEFGLKKGFMTTIHAYTNDQRLHDFPHKDLRRARAAAVSIIPTTTGAAKAIGLAIPELKGKLDGISMRVPIPDGSIVDLVCELEKEVTAEEINAAMKKAAEGSLKGVLEYTEDPIVSIDVIGNPHTSIFDATSTTVMGETGTFVKILSWYDNEWGFSAKLVDLIKFIA